MKSQLILLAVITPLIAACVIPGYGTPTPTVPPTSLPTLPPPTPLPPSPAPIPTSPADPAMAAVRPIPGTVALDFVALVCSATWSSSIRFNACPGDPNDLTNGYVTPLKNTTIRSGEVYDLPSLLTIPPQGDNIRGGVFGRYPAITIQPGDRFRAVLACQPGFVCSDVEYSLDFYSADGKYHSFPPDQPNPFKEFAENNHGPWFIDIPLDFLAGQTVEFTLVIRDMSFTQGDRYLWVAPHIFRDPANTRATPKPPITQNIPIEIGQYTIMAIRNEFSWQMLTNLPAPPWIPPIYSWN